MDIQIAYEAIICLFPLPILATPVVLLQPIAQTLKTGEQIILVCEAECYPPAPEYFWFHCRGQDRIPIPGSSSSRLIISNANGAHSGLYVCRVRNPHMNDEKKAYSFSEWVRVEVAAPEHVIVHSPIRQGRWQFTLYTYVKSLTVRRLFGELYFGAEAHGSAESLDALGYNLSLFHPVFTTASDPMLFVSQRYDGVELVNFDAALLILFI